MTQPRKAASTQTSTTMKSIIHPIPDEASAERALELFLAGYDPLLYAADLGLTPEQVFDQIRATLRIYIARVLESPAEIGRRGGQATSDAKAAAASDNLAKARAKRWPKKNGEGK